MFQAVFGERIGQKPAWCARVPSCLTPSNQPGIHQVRGSQPPFQNRARPELDHQSAANSFTRTTICFEGHVMKHLHRDLTLRTYTSNADRFARRIKWIYCVATCRAQRRRIRCCGCRGT